jgi:hypothetical protein
MRALTDDVRATLTALPEYDREYAAALYPENAVMKKLIAEDETRFEAALRKTGVPAGPEPIGELSERYAASVDALAAASELGLSKSDLLRHLTQSDVLRQLGLATLLTGGSVKRDAWEDAFGDVIHELQIGNSILPARAYGERFFSGSPITPRRTVPPLVTDLGDRLSAIFAAVVGRPVRTIENGRERTYSIKNVRASQCSAEIQDVTRLTEANSPARWWSEEDTQSFSLQAARVSLNPEGPVSRLTVRTDTPAIRLERTFLSSNQWTDTTLPRSGSRVEFVDTVIFDLPPGSAANEVLRSMQDAVAACSRFRG